MTIDSTAINSELDLEIEGDGSEDTTPLPLSPSQRMISTDQSDPEIESLYNKAKRGKLVLRPFFQRTFVWDRQKASRLIESTLLGVPLPLVYLAREADGTESVIDGQQRLTAFFSFIDGALPNKEPFRLSGLTVFKDEYEGKAFNQLPEAVQDRIRYYHLRTITILPDSDPNLKFEIFERLNTGSVPLNDMELRNAVYWGPYIDLLRELAADTDFNYIIGFKGADTRMRDVELVLRFAAFYHATYLKYQAPVKSFLNRDMERYRRLSLAEAAELRKAFKNTVAIVRSLFGDKAFKRYHRGSSAANPGGTWETKRFNASLYDVWMGVFADRDKNQVYAALDALREGLIDLMSSNEEFNDAILIGTSEPSKVRKRFDLARMRVDEILQNYKPQSRCFSLQLKQDLFKQDPTCAICGNHIQEIDDAAVDHVEQYWRGGQTLPENARLAHRYCNWSRPRND